MNDDFNNFLGPVHNGEVMGPKKEVPTDIEKDLVYARENLYSVIEKGVNALDEIIVIAKTSQDAKAFEVVSILMKTLTDANKNLVLLSKAKKEENKVIQAEKKITNNNLFVGSTMDLQKLITKMKERE